MEVPRMRLTLKTTCLAILLTAALAIPTTSFAQSAEDEAAAATASLSGIEAARRVEDRVAYETEGPFEADGERVYIWLEFQNPDRIEQVFTLDWHFVDRNRHSTQTIEVGASSRWRTWVYRTLREPTVGNWHVEVRAGDGTVLGQVDFEVIPAAPDGEEAVTTQASQTE
jgi:hypothetical protein